MFVRLIDITVTFPKLNVRPTLPEMTIDPTLAHGDIGLKQIGPLMKGVAAEAQAAGQQAIAQMAREGDRLARVEESANAIAEIASEKWPPLRELNVDVAPKHRPQVKVEPGQLSVQLQPGEVKVNVSLVMATGNVIDVRA